MSTPRLLCVRRAAATNRRPLSNRSSRAVQVIIRCQSTKPSAAKGGFRAGRFAAYTLTTTGLALGGAIAYANYDPMFKKQADDIIPGFARLADTVADLFVDRVGSTRPQQGTGTTGKSRAGVGREKVGEVRRPRERKESVVDGGNRVEGEVVTNQQSDPKDEAQTKEEAVPMKDNEEVMPTASVGPQAALEPENTQLLVGLESGVGGMEGEGSPVKEVGSESGAGVEGREEREVEGGGVERAVEEVREEVKRVAGEGRVKKVKEAQMADQGLDWLKDSAQVEKKLEQTLEEFRSQTNRLDEAQSGLLTGIREHSQLLKEVTGSSSAAAEDDVQSVYDTADAIHRAQETVQESLKTLKRTQENHKSLLHDINKLMNRAMDLGLKSKVAEVDEKVMEYMGRLAEGADTIKQAEVERELLVDYHRQARKDREQLQRELGQELPEGDSRQEAVLVMLGRRLEVLKEKLTGMEKEHQERLTAALEKQKESLEKLAEGRLQWRLREKERELKQELSYQADKIHREYQSELREQLKRQTDSHNHLLTNSLNTQEEQLAGKWSRELELKLTEQESHYQGELALALSRLRGIEYMVNTIATAGNETRRQQSMRAAIDGLHTALKSASTSPDPEERLLLQREVRDLREAAKDDPFVLAILDSLPAHASSSKGIQGEGGLRERFTRVKQICRRVALVPERGGGMGTYALSYLQSMLIVSWRFVGRVAGSGNMDEEDFEKMDTFDILERADTCLRQGDMDLAVRYVNLLRGAPRGVARDWLCDARSYLETLQAIQLVSEYMAALNITASSSSSSSTEATPEAQTN